MAGYCLQKHQHRLPYSGRRIEHLPGHYLYAPTTGDRSYKTFLWLRISRCNGQSGYRVVTAVPKKTITLWSNTVNELTASRFKFIRKSFQQLLPTAANLIRWKRITDPVCHLCNNGQWQTNKHVLSNCNSTSALTRYARRHNLVLEKITEWILETKSND